MKRLSLIVLSVLFYGAVFGQKPWFQLYEDSISISKDANKISALFNADLKAIYPDLDYYPTAKLRTTPLLIYQGQDNISYYPLWHEVSEPLQNWFYEIGASENDGKKIFTLFFNGFYLPHEMAHGFEAALNNLKKSFDNEYFANTAAMLWWRKHGYDEQLKECYQYAQKILEKTPNPVPEGQSTQQFFTTNYDAILQSGNPYIYAYMQFNQFVKIYEDTTLPGFDEFIRNYNTKK